MLKIFLFISITLFFGNSIFAQPKSRQDLEKERAQLRKEIEENQKLQAKIKSATKENLNTLLIVGRKADLQERVVDNVSKDINLLDNNIYGIQRDINKYDKLLDTLRQEYSKSMVYAYKNKGNYEFLNFIFSAENFNDAVKRIAYLKTYRTFREMQGQNILRTQALRRKRLEDLGVTKQTKTAVLTVQEQEMKKIAEQKAEQDRIVENLKKQGKSIDALIADKKRREAKINGYIKAAIAKALKEARDKEIALEKAAKLKREIEARAIAAAEKAKRDAEAKALADAIAKQKALKTNPSVTTTSPKVTQPIGKNPEISKLPKVTAPVVEPTKVSKVNDAAIPSTPTVAPTAPYVSPNALLNASFERSKGALPWPVDNHSVITSFGPYRLQSGANGGFNTFVSIASPIGSAVKAVFDGEVILIQEMEYGKYIITIKHGIKYYTSYINVSSVAVRLNQEIKAGQLLGKVASNLDGIGSIDFSLAKEKIDVNPELWLHR